MIHKDLVGAAATIPERNAAVLYSVCFYTVHRKFSFLLVPVKLFLNLLKKHFSNGNYECVALAHVKDRGEF